MREQREHRVQGVAELIRNEQYEVDPTAVADAMLRQMCWDDVPDIFELTARTRPRRRILRLRDVLRARRRAGLTVRPRPQLSH